MSALTFADAAKPAFAAIAVAFFELVIERRPHTVGPPAAAVGQQTAEVPALAARPTLGRERDEGPAGAEEELLEVGLEPLELREVVEEVAPRRAVAGYAKQDAGSVGAVLGSMAGLAGAGRKRRSARR